MATRHFKVEKLIRDKMLEFMQSRGIRVHEQRMETTEYIEKLKDKLIEEAAEVKVTNSRAELVEELADALEVIQAISNAIGIPLQQIEEKRKEKKQAKGGFDLRIFNSRVEIEEENPAINYYLRRSHQYPEYLSPAQDPHCLFCQIAQRKRAAKFFAEFKHCFAIKDEYPVSNGHLLIIPKDHTENWFTAHEEVRLDMMSALHNLKSKIDAELSPHGYNIGANCGEVAGQSVMHLHLHIIPRYRGDMENPKGGVRGVIPSKQKY